MGDWFVIINPKNGREVGSVRWKSRTARSRDSCAAPPGANGQESERTTWMLVALLGLQLGQRVPLPSPRGTDVSAGTHAHLYVPGRETECKCLPRMARAVLTGAREVPPSTWGPTRVTSMLGTPGGRGGWWSRDTLFPMCMYAVGGTFSVCSLFWGGPGGGVF